MPNDTAPEKAPVPPQSNDQRKTEEEPRSQAMPNTPGGPGAQARLFDIVASMLAEATPSDDD